MILKTGGVKERYFATFNGLKKVLAVVRCPGRGEELAVWVRLRV